MTPDRETEVLIIGAGPIGLELAIELKKRGINYAQVDASQVGATISWFAPGTHFFSSPERIAIGGVPLQTLDQTKATREEYLSYLRSIVLQFNLEIQTHERVVAISRQEDGTFFVNTQTQASERLWRASKVVLAIGDMHRPRRINVPGEDLPHVSHYFADPHVYFRRRVLIVGGRNSAVEAAIRCFRIGALVSLSYRGDDFDAEHIKFWLLPEIRSMVRDGRIDFYPRTTVRAIGPDRVLLDRDHLTLEVRAEVVLLLTGYEQDPSLLESAGVNLVGEARRPQFDESTMETNVPGLFVAGTAVAGTQRSGFGAREFIETTHIHVDRIVAAITGTAAPAEMATHGVPES